MIQPYTALEAKQYLQGRWVVEIFEPDGETLVNRFKFKNANPLAALDDLLSVYLGAGTQKTTWYFGLINNSPSPSLASSDTAASHAGWSEFTNYTQSVRQTWTPGSVSGQSITNPSSASFTMDTGGGAVYGAFLISNSTKSGTTGLLWATGAFPAVQTLSVGQILRTIYTSTAAAA